MSKIGQLLCTYRKTSLSFLTMLAVGLIVQTYGVFINSGTDVNTQSFIKTKNKKINTINKKIHHSGSSAITVTNNMLETSNLSSETRKQLETIKRSLSTLLENQSKAKKLTSSLGQLSLDQRKRLTEANQQLMKQHNASKIPAFYLRKNQGIQVGDDNNFFGVQDLGYDKEDIDVTLNSDHHELDAGERISFKSHNGTCFVSYMGQASEGLFKFGLNCD